jgi:hypothetical protein
LWIFRTPRCRPSPPKMMRNMHTIQ